MDNKRVILIESILGGESDNENFAGSDQFQSSLGIDPSLGTTQGYSTGYGNKPSGFIRPVPVTTASTTTSAGVAWMTSTPDIGGNQSVYLYDLLGSAYTCETFPGSFSITALSDGGALSNSTGNGMEYYDNYVYFAKNTTVARYGPLNGTPAFNGDYWVTTLAKTALTDAVYPSTGPRELRNHPMHVHSDGKLYFADVVGGQGVLHYIATTKTSVEGDTNNGSTYNKLDFPYKHVISSIESYGSSLAVALVQAESPDSNNRVRPPAKIALWDTTSQNYNIITNKEFTDSVIIALKNINGSLYVVSSMNTTSNAEYVRVSVYMGGYSFREVAYYPYINTFLQGMISGTNNFLAVAGKSDTPRASSNLIFSLGLPSGREEYFPKQFTPFVSTAGNTDDITAILATGRNYGGGLISSWARSPSDVGSNGDTRVETSFGTVFNNSQMQLWQSQIFRIGQPFKITKIRIPLAGVLPASGTITPTLIVDNVNDIALDTITSTKYGTNTQLITMRPTTSGAGPVGDHNFALRLEFSSASLMVVALPITIEYELMDVDTAYP